MYLCSMKATFIGLVVLLIAITAAAESVFGGWSVTERREEIDDSIITSATLYEENHQAILYVRCWRDEIEVFVKSLVGEFHEQNVEVRIRIDDDPPEHYVWIRSTNRTFAFVPKDEIESLIERFVDMEDPNKGKRFLVKVPVGYTFSFNVGGFLWAFVPVGYACGFLDF